MLSRLRKKLYLSNRITGSPQDTLFNSAENDEGGDQQDDSKPNIGTEELLTMLRRGARVVTYEESNAVEMSGLTWETVLERYQRVAADEKASSPQATTKEAEIQWLSQIEKVQSHILDGKILSKKQKVPNSLISTPELRREDRRVRKNTMVMAGEYSVSKGSLDCGPWEAIATVSNKEVEPVHNKQGKMKILAHQNVSQFGPDSTACILTQR